MPPGLPIRKHQGAFSAKIYIDDPVTPTTISIIDQDGKTIGGYSPAGVADDVKINAALAAYPNVILPDGPLVLAASITGIQSYGMLRGYGRNTVLKPSANDITMIAPTAKHMIQIEDIRIDALAFTGIKGIDVVNCTAPNIRGIYLKNTFVGVGISGIGTLWPDSSYSNMIGRIAECDVYGANAQPGAVGFYNYGAGAGEYITWIGCNARYVVGGDGTGAGFRTDTGNNQFIGCSSLSCDNGIILSHGSSNPGKSSITGGHWNHNINGIVLHEGYYYTINGVHVIANSYGIILEGSKSNTISGNIIGDNSNIDILLRDSGSVYATNNLIQGNQIYSIGVIHSHGIKEEFPSATELNTIMANAFRGTFSTAAIARRFAPPNTTIIKNNTFNGTRYKTDNIGSSTGTGSEQTIAHGLAEIAGHHAWIKYLVDTRYISEVVPFDATNIYPTVETGVAYEWRIE
jgi:parallel beta-helix repeat protein